MKRIVYTRNDGGISIVVPSPEFKGSTKELAAQTVPKGLPWRESELYEIPADRTFRDAWQDNGKINVDMPKARTIHMSRIRTARDAKLKELDIEQLKGNDVSTEKQSLRDLPGNFDLSKARTPEELKALWPEGL